MTDHSPQTIDLAPDIGNPVGYLVVHFEGSHGVWEMFDHLNDAQECARRQEEEHKFWCKTTKDWDIWHCPARPSSGAVPDIYPLYAGKPFKNSEQQ